MRNPPPPGQPGKGSGRNTPPKTEGPPPKDGLWRRVTGRPQLEAAMRQRYMPYRYESNQRSIRWVIAGLAAWIICAGVLAWSDASTAATLRDFRKSGITTIPTTSTDPEDIFAFAEKEGLDCSTLDQIRSSSPGCDTAISVRARFADTQDRSFLIFAIAFVVIIATAFPWGTFIHRAGRNLLTLKSEGQRSRPDSVVLWTVLAGAAFSVFVPFGRGLTFFRVSETDLGPLGTLPAMTITGLLTGSLIAVLILLWKVRPGFAELLRGSDPALPLDDPEGWKRQGTTHPVLYLWLAASALIFVVNPISILNYLDRDDLAQLIGVTERLIWTDLLLVLPAAAAMAMVVVLHRQQEQRHARVGDIEVTPPRPKDPIEEELEKQSRARQRQRKG
jgi:hypothetical protein